MMIIIIIITIIIMIIIISMNVIIIVGRAANHERGVGVAEEAAADRDAGHEDVPWSPGRNLDL